MKAKDMLYDFSREDDKIMCLMRDNKELAFSILVARNDSAVSLFARNDCFNAFCIEDAIKFEVYANQWEVSGEIYVDLSQVVYIAKRDSKVFVSNEYFSMSKHWEATDQPFLDYISNKKTN